MSNQERVSQLLRAHPGLTDREIRERTGISPHQQVNQITNRLAQLGTIRRVREGGLYRNYLREPKTGSESASRGATRSTGPSVPAPATRRRSVQGGDEWLVPALSNGTAMLVLPCSSDKRHGGSDLSGPSILDYLPHGLADELVARRATNAVSARLASDGLMPAWRRYCGHLYQAAEGAVQSLTEAGVPTVIISGGYGLVLADEPIAWYDARFAPGNWPAALVPRCLAAVATALKVDRAVGLAGGSTSYARVIRQVRWPVDAVLLTPDNVGGGAMRRTPRIIGEAVRLLTRVDLDETWSSSDGIAIRKEQLT